MFLKVKLLCDDSTFKNILFNPDSESGSETHGVKQTMLTCKGGGLGFVAEHDVSIGEDGHHLVLKELDEEGGGQVDAVGLVLLRTMLGSLNSYPHIIMRGKKNVTKKNFKPSWEIWKLVFKKRYGNFTIKNIRIKKKSDLLYNLINCFF